MPQKSYFINLQYNNGEIEIENVVQKPIYSFKDYRKSNYNVKIKDIQKQDIFESNIFVPNKIYPLPGTDGSIIYQDNFEFSLILSS